MKIIRSRLFSISAVFLMICSLAFDASLMAQSRTQRPDKQQGDGKKNRRPTEEERRQAEEERKKQEEEQKAEIDNEPLIIKTNLVSVDAVVYHKKSGQIIAGLKKENFAVFENGVKQEIANFSMPESPITVSLVVEYSRWTEVFGFYGSRGQEKGILEVIRPVAYFLQRFIKPPDDYASVIAFDIRPTPITDFTNDPNQLSRTVDLLFRNSPAFRENNLFDAIKFALVGGKGDAVVLDDSKSKQRTIDYGGMTAVNSKRRAIILVASGIDTFSKTRYDEVRKVIQNSGIPIYILSTGNLFFKLYENRLPATDGIDGMPGRLTFLQAQNAMNTFAKESGGMHFPITFESEVPSALQSVNALLRSQYNLAYDISDKPREPGKKYNISVKVDVNGDGIYDDKEFTVQHRPFYSVPK